MFTTLLLNQYFVKTLGVIRVTLNTGMMLFQVVVLICIYVKWVFPNPESDLQVEGDEEVPIDEENIEEALAEVESQKAASFERKEIMFWLQLEILVFFANIMSNCVYLLLRSCCQSRI